MFYSHEILTNRKYGVATIWLVATLGAKSGTKTLSRKTICDVNLQKACDTIVEPDAPMALRLQSNLLYGVVRVYNQQCGYVLHDAQTAQAALRTLFKSSRANELDPAAGKARPDQIMLMDDPAFLPELALPPLEDFDFLSLDIQNKDSQRSTQSMMSIQRVNSCSESSVSLPALNYQSSRGSSVALKYRLPNDDPFAVSSAHKVGTRGEGGEEEALMYDDDIDFEFDGEGILRENISPVEADPRRRAGSVLLPAHVSSSAASGRVRKDHEFDNFAAAQFGRNNEEDVDIVQYGDEELPDAEPFGQLRGTNDGFFMSGALQAGDQPLHLDVPDLVHERSSEKRSSEERDSSPDSAEAPQKRRKTKIIKNLVIDTTLAFRNNDLIRMKDSYLDNMAALTKNTNRHKGVIQAKKNALQYVFGTGIMGIGDGIGSFKFAGPLGSFAGGALMDKITGGTLPVREKRVRMDANDDDEEGQASDHSSKRARQDGEVGRGYEEEALVFNFDEGIPVVDRRSSVGTEVGRNAPSALLDYPSSAMPWNISASAHSHQRGLSSKGPGSIVSGGRRPVSESPLIGRGSNLPGNLDQFSQMNEDDNIMYGRDDDFQSISGGSQPNFGLPSSRAGPLANENTAAEFELFGPAAAVDTQTARQSQWVRAALDRESNNFFEYVKLSIDEKAVDELDFEREGNEGENKFVTFEELFDAKKNSAVVAAQAFYHILTLATKARIWVKQDEHNEVVGGEIKLGITI